MDIKQQLSADKSSDKTDSASIEKGTIRGGLKAWAKKLSVETGGIERVTDEERLSNTTHVWNAYTFWFVKPNTRRNTRKLMSIQVECEHGGSNALHRHGWWQHGTGVLGLLCYHPRGEHCVVSPASLDRIFRIDRLAHDNLLVRISSIPTPQVMY